jgi:hypothetical protein
MKRKTGFRIGDSLSTVHRSLFTVLTLSLLATFAPRAEAVEATNSGGVVTTYTDAGLTWIYHVFTNAGASGMKFHTLAAGGTVELLVVAGGGSGGGALHNGAGGGAGGLIYTNYTVTHNTDYAVTVGSGGVAIAVNTGANGKDGQDSTFASAFTAKGGGGGAYDFGAGAIGRTGGSAGGGSRGGAGGTALNLTPMQGNNGGAGVNNPSYGSGGGGGAGSAGLPGVTTIGAGDGGSGTNLPAFVLWGDPNNLGWFAGGGGGACDTVSGAGSTRAGIGGKGGGGNGGTNITGQLRNGQSGQSNTGGGGGAAYSRATDSASGAGGSGIVILRYQSLPPVLPASGGDITYPTNLNGKVYGVHIFTNTVGTNYFTTTRDFKVEYLVIGGGGAGCNEHGGGGGGAGGYRCSVPSEFSSSLSNAEPRYSVSANVAYPVVVGVGGAGLSWSAVPARVNQGGDSWFTNIVATGGGCGKQRTTPNPAPFSDGGSGGGGGGNSDQGAGPFLYWTNGVGMVSQGFSGGKYSDSGSGQGGGGGGAGGPGIDGNVASYGGDGGTGLWSSITGVAVGRAGGGQGARPIGSSTGATQCGGGTNGLAGVASTGGGGASKGTASPTGNGGSGVVIIRYDMSLPKGTVIMMR